MGEGPTSRSTKAVINFPAARDEGLLVETVGDETVVYDLESKEAHCLKPLAALVFSSADGKTSAGEIASLAEKQLGEPITEAQVQEAMGQLEASALLLGPAVLNDGNGFNRRQMIGRSAVAAGGAFAGASLITSILAPTAMAGTSQIQPGCSGCGTNHDCAPAPGEHDGHCCQSTGTPGKTCNAGCCTPTDNSCHVCPANCGAPPAPACNCTVDATLLGGSCPSNCPTGSCCTPIAAC
jgi:hypothetical protein